MNRSQAGNVWWIESAPELRLAYATQTMNLLRLAPDIQEAILNSLGTRPAHGEANVVRSRAQTAPARLAHDLRCLPDGSVLLPPTA